VVSIRQARAAATQRGEPMPYVDFIREQRAALATGARAAIVVKLQADQPDDPAGRAAEERLIRDILGADPGRLELSRTARKTALLRAVERRLAVARREVRA